MGDAKPDGPLALKEAALENVREALAAANSAPATALDEGKHEQLRSAADSLRAVEKGLVNELDQLQNDA